MAPALHGKRRIKWGWLRTAIGCDEAVPRKNFGASCKYVVHICRRWHHGFRIEQGIVAEPHAPSRQAIWDSERQACTSTDHGNDEDGEKEDDWLFQKVGMRLRWKFVWGERVWKLTAHYVIDIDTQAARTKLWKLLSLQHLSHHLYLRIAGTLSLSGLFQGTLRHSLSYSTVGYGKPSFTQQRGWTSRMTTNTGLPSQTPAYLVQESIMVPGGPHSQAHDTTFLGCQVW